MSGEIWVAIISGLFTLVGVIITVIVGNKLTIYRIEQLEKKVELHNNAVERLFVAEGNIKTLQHDVKNIIKSEGN